MKCSPAVGAAAEPASRAYTVWYRDGSASGSTMYGGSGVSPAGSPSRRTRQRPSPRCSRSVTGPYVRPGRSRRVGRASASHSSAPVRSSSSTSPRGRSSGMRAGTTRVSFATTSSPRSSSGSSAKRRCRTAPVARS